MIRINQVSKTYKTGQNVAIKALNHVSFDLPNTGLIFIVGKSGSGKSTLLNILAGLDKPDSGDIIIEGHSSRAFNQADFDSYRNTVVGFVFQEYNLIETFNVLENIRLSLSLQGKTATIDAVGDCLKEVDLAGYEQRQINELSGGQKQRVAIARAIIKTPKILIADEPTGALDSETGQMIFETLKKLSATRLVVVVSHDMQSAKTYADRIIELKDGEIIKDVEKTSGKTFTTTNKEIKDNPDPAFKLIKSKFPFINAFKIGISTFKYKRFRLILSILLASIAFMLFASVDALASYQKVEALTRSLLSTDNKTISLEQYERSYLNGQQIIKSIYTSEAAYQSILNEYPDMTFLPVYVDETYDYNISNYYRDFTNQTEQDTFNYDNYHTSNLSGFMYLNTDSDASLYDMHLIEGNWASNDDDIVITKYIADSIIQYGYKDIESNTVYDINKGQYVDLIGKSLFNKTISGIADTNLFEARYESLKDTRLAGDQFSSLNTEFSVVVEKGIHALGFLKPGASKIADPNGLSGITYYLSNDNPMIYTDKYISLDDIDINLFTYHSTKDIALFESNEYLISRGKAKQLFSHNVSETNPLIESLFGTSIYQNQSIYELYTNYLTVESIKAATTYQTRYPDYESHTADIIYQKAVEMAFEGLTVYNYDLLQILLNGLYAKLEIDALKQNYVFDEVIHLDEVVDYFEPKRNTYNFHNSTNYSYEEYINLFQEDDIWLQIRSLMLQLGEDLKLDDKLSYNDLNYISETTILKDFIMAYDANISIQYLGVLEGIPNQVIAGFYDQNDSIPNAIIGIDDPFLKSDISKENGLQYAYIIGTINGDYQAVKALVRDHYNKDQTTYFVIHNELIPQMGMIGNVITSTKSILIYAALGFAIFSSLLLINYISISVREKKKDIGILRALGTRNIDVIKIFLIESLIISMINLVLSSILFSLLTLYVNQSIKASNGLSLVLIYPSIRQYILIMIISLFVSIISTVFPVKSITSMKPIDAIRSI